VGGVTINTPMAYTVKQLAQLAGVSVRTLHHYDEIGLLTPPVIGANGYRYYDERSALRLQSILFYRELDFTLEAIKAVLDRPDFDALTALQEQRSALEAKLGRLHRLIATIDDTIGHLKGEKTMSTKQLFAGLTLEQEKAYTDEAATRWGEKGVRASQQKYNAYSAAEKARIGAEGEAVYRDLLAAMPDGPAAPAVQACVERWRRHIGYFWTPNDQQCLALATGYRDDPAFRKTYDAIHPELAAFMVEAVRIYIEGRRSKSK
jgi:DNA-binding transcriptional MerR regulator